MKELVLVILLVALVLLFVYSYGGPATSHLRKLDIDGKKPHHTHVTKNDTVEIVEQVFTAPSPTREPGLLKPIIVLGPKSTKNQNHVRFADRRHERIFDATGQIIKEIKVKMGKR